MKMKLIIALAAGAFAANAYGDYDVNAILAGIRADIAATDYVRRNPSQLDAQVKLFYDGAVEIRRQQNEVIPLGIYLNIEQRLLENNGLGTVYGLSLTAAIVNAAAQRRGDVNITWEDVRPLLVSVSEFIKTNEFDLKAATNSVLHGMRTSDGWVKNYSEAYSKSNAQPTLKNDAGTATPSPEPSLKTAEQQSTIASPTPEQKARGNPQEQIDALTSDITSRLAADNQISASSKFRQDCIAWNSYVEQLPTAAKATAMEIRINHLQDVYVSAKARK
jgi:hypothetical protein